MSYFHETIWKGVPKFLRRVDTALKNIGINERIPYNAPLIQFSSWMGGDRDGMDSCRLLLLLLRISMLFPYGGKRHKNLSSNACVLSMHLMAKL